MKFKHMIVAAIAATLSISSAANAFAADYPITLENKFGSVTIEKQPVRVVSLSYTGADNLLAFGIKPVAIRYWYGDFEYGVWPWAQDALGDHKPAVLKGDLNIEQIASLNPDVIFAMASGITQEQYELLSAIAPTIAPEKQYTDYSTPWQVMAVTAGKVLGISQKVGGMVGKLESRIVKIAKGHPEWQGKTATVSFYFNGTPGGYRSIDGRAQLLKRLGFDTPKLLDDAAAADQFYASISPEDLTPLEADVLIWMVAGDALKGVKDMPLRKAMKAHKEGREVLANDMLAGAFSYSSLLSLPFALDKLIPEIELAVDGDPMTVVPTAKEAGLTD